MGKKPGFGIEEHQRAGSDLAAIAEIVGGWVAKATAEYPSSSPPAKAAAKAAAALQSMREEFEGAAHRERVPHSMMVYHLDTLPAPGDGAVRVNGAAPEEVA